MSRRRDNLSFAHHEEVAPLEPEQQEYWLDKSEKEYAIETKERMLLGKKNEDPTVKLQQGKDIYFSVVKPIYEAFHSRLPEEYE